MAGGSRRPSISKRQKERNRQERKQQKAERLARRREEKKKVAGTGRDADQDLADIVPGPQPLPWEN